MNWLEEENKIKLDLLQSLARSQRALSLMIESMAEVVGSSNRTAQELVHQIEAISRYQREIAVKMIGVRIRKLRRGVPAQPWLGPKLKRRFPK
jgi:hypothetical protein